MLGVEQFVETWKMLNVQRSIVNGQSPDGRLDTLTIDN
jgi:hypothetical protein